MREALTGRASTTYHQRLDEEQRRLDMSIACIGNMNNNFFSLVRYLRDAGVDAKLLLFDNEFEHFHPSADAYDESYEAFTVKLDWGRHLDLTRVSASRIREDLAAYDQLIGCGAAPAYCHKAGRQLDLFIPYATDIREYPFWIWKYFRKGFRSWRPAIALRGAQRRGIKNARHTLMDYTNAEYDSVVEALRIAEKRIHVGVPMVYTPIYNPASIEEYYERSRYFGAFKEVRAAQDLVVFHHSRHGWGPGFDIDTDKANDVLLRGFAAFWQETAARAAIVTFEYPKSVPEPKQLCRELGIEDRVFWFPLMERRELMVGLSLADMGAGEFGESYLSGGTIYETLAMGKPLMQRRDDAIYRRYYDELYPVLNVEEPDDVHRVLLDYEKRVDYYEDLGRQGCAWHQRIAIERPCRTILDLLESK